ncbi:MAG: ATP-binding cassette domain-containing protein [Bacilli bacterium]|nr:ATP-binding cassette domain-containing protein [Bacilli bacterium]
MFEVKDLGKKFVTSSETKWVLRHVGFSLPSKGLFAIKGTSGSGKSTLLNLLSGSLKPDEGEILLDGRKLHRFSEKELEDYRCFSCGFIYQHFNLFEELSVFENVAMPLSLQGKSKKEITNNVDKYLSLFQIEKLKGKKASFLSGGEKQRVAIARAVISNPKIIFADEPTGALDFHNEKIIMDSLKEISKSCLVILVSHNQRLIDTYADHVFLLENGQINCGNVPYIIEGMNEAKPPKRKSSKNWLKALLFQNYKREGVKNVLSIVSSFIGFSALLLSFGFLIGSQNTIKSEKRRNLQYLSASVSIQESKKIEGSPLSLTQQGRPDYYDAYNLVKDIGGVTIQTDYSYFFPIYGPYSLNGLLQKEVSFYPVFDITLRERKDIFKIEGRLPKSNDLDSVIVNKQFADQFEESPIGKTIFFDRDFEVSYNQVRDYVSLPYRFYISAVVEEFSFLNTPKVYYSYSGLDQLMKSTILEKISSAKGKEVSVYDLCEICQGNSPYSSYAYWAFAHNEDSGDKLKNLSLELENSKNKYSVSSAAYAVETSYQSLTSAFLTSILPFLAIEIAGVAFIISFLAYSSFLSNKKQAAILFAMGARNGDTKALYQMPSLINSLIAAILSIALIPIFNKYGSLLISHLVGIERMITIPLGSVYGIPFFVFLVIPLFAAIIALIGAGLPLLKARKSSLVEELKDE